jgi:hypothetical protein
MIKSKGIKAASQLAGLLLCMLLIQTAFAEDLTVDNTTTGNSTIGNTTIGNATTGDTSTGNATGNATVNSINPSGYSTSLLAGSSTQFAVSFTNGGNETLILTPKVVAMPNSQKNIDESWITILPTNATVAPGSVQNFTVDINIPTDTENGDYQAALAFTDDLVPNSPQYVNSMQLDVSVQAQPKIELQSSYLSDNLEAGREYVYKIDLKNIASKDITIDPKMNVYNPGYEQAFGNDAIEVSAPSTIKAGEVANMTVLVHVPENATGNFNGYIDMNVDGKANDGANPQMSLYFNVWQQPVVPYVKNFNTVTNAPIMIEVSTDMYNSDMGLRYSPKNEEPSFELGLAHNSSPVNLTFVKSVESGSVTIGGSYPHWAAENENSYQSYNEHYVETYVVPGAIGDWKLNILPKHTNNFGYSITVGDSNPTKIEDPIADNSTIGNGTADNSTIGNGTADNSTIGNVTNGIIADFSVSPACGKAPLTVAFTDLSTGSPTLWNWYFGDGTNSTEQNPEHTYCKGGNYTVSLTIENATDNNTKTMPDYITVKK